MRYEGKIWEQKRPNQYDKFLWNSGNKISLEKYLLNDWNKKQVSTFQGKENDTTFDTAFIYLRKIVSFKWKSYMALVQI